MFRKVTTEHFHWHNSQPREKKVFLKLEEIITATLVKGIFFQKFNRVFEENFTNTMRITISFVALKYLKKPFTKGNLEK